MEPTDSEVFDLFVSQALDRYRDMQPIEAYAAIAAEWHDQMAAVLSVFISKSRCRECGKPLWFVHRGRKNGASSYIDLKCGCRSHP